MASTQWALLSSAFNVLPFSVLSFSNPLFARISLLVKARLLCSSLRLQIGLRVQFL